MAEPITLKQLVEKGELSKYSCDEMGKLWITNANQLYCLIRSAVRHGTDEMKTRLAEDLAISQENLLAYAEYIKTYVSDSVVNPQTTGQHQTGGLITEEQRVK